MPKVFRLFLKDVRHLWPEILLSLGLTAGFAATQYLTWPAFHHEVFRESDSLAAWIVGLMLLSWALLIARAVQDESLVGNRQFWLTRPYGWASILGSKLLFIASFILLPFFLAQCSLVLRAGISPTRVIPSLLFISFILLCYGAIPLLAVGTITSSIGRIILIALGLAVYVGIAVYLVDIFITAPVWKPHSESSWIALTCFIPVICAAVIVLQYALRRIGVAIALLLAMVAFGTALSVIEEKTYWLGRAIPTLAANEQPPVRFTRLPPQAEVPSSNLPADAMDKADPITLKIPLQVAVAPGNMVIISGRERDWSLLMQSGNAILPRQEGWSPYNGGHLMQGGVTDEQLSIPRHDFTGADHAMLSLHLTYAVDEYEPVSTSIVAAAQAIDVPENGHCVTVSSWVDESDPRTKSSDLECMYAGRSPSLTRVQYRLRTNCTANAPSADPAENFQKEAWFGDSDIHPEPVWSGVATPNSNLDTQLPRHDRAPVALCPGEPMRFTRFRLLRRRIITVDLPPFDPMPYQTLHSEVDFSLIR